MIPPARPTTLPTKMLLSLVAVLSLQTHAAESTQAPVVVSSQEKTLDQCLAEALQNNRRRPASRFAVAMAEAQHRQALAAHWPQITLRAAVERLDERPNFIFPARAFPVPAQNFTIPFGGSLPITIPGIGTIPLSTFQIPEQTITVPAQEVILQDRDSAYGSLGATWLLYDGGMRKGYREQGKGLVDLRKEEARRTDLEIADSVKRFYYGSVLAAQVHHVGKETLARMEATLNLTETMYKEGSGRVKKTDWLETKVVVESLRSMVALLEKNEAMAQAALANTIGLSWNAVVKPADKFLLKEGIALQIKDAFLSLNTAQKGHDATREAMNAAIESRDLNTRAYQNDLVDTEKVIRAQIMEALMSATHYKTRYDHLALQSQITLLVGTELIKRIEGRR